MCVVNHTLQYFLGSETEDVFCAMLTKFTTCELRTQARKEGQGRSGSGVKDCDFTG